MVYPIDEKVICVKRITAVRLIAMANSSYYGYDIVVYNN